MAKYLNNVLLATAATTVINLEIKQKIFNQTVFLGIFGILCLVIIVNLQFPRLRNITDNNYKRAEEVEKVKLDTLKSLPAFGFDNLLADWTFLQFIQYYGDGEARKVTGYKLSPEYLDIIVKNDPRYVRAYLAISPASSINAGRPDRTIELMEKGLKQIYPELPGAYLVWLYKGVDQLLFLGDIKGAKQSYQMAADWGKIAGDERLARAAQDTVDFLAKNPDSKTAQVGAWFLVYVNTEDKETRQLAKSKVESLGGELIDYGDGRIFAKPPKQD